MLVQLSQGSVCVTLDVARAQNLSLSPQETFLHTYKHSLTCSVTSDGQTSFVSWPTLILPLSSPEAAQRVKVHLAALINLCSRFPHTEINPSK